MSTITADQSGWPEAIGVRKSCCSIGCDLVMSVGTDIFGTEAYKEQDEQGRGPKPDKEPRHEATGPPEMPEIVCRVWTVAAA
jgi:hypothetical protein